MTTEHPTVLQPEMPATRWGDPALAAEEPLRSGTGLALTKSLARANALSLSFDEEPGAGTLMSLEIPAGKVVHT